MDSGNFILRDYQQDIVARVFEAWHSHRSVMVQMPTGTGKTHVLAAIVNEECRMKNEELPFDCRRERKPNTNARCIWIVAHRRELVVQIEETIQRMYAGVAGNSSFFILHSSFPKSSSLIRVFSIQWLSRHWEDVEDKPSLIVIDEAHHALADTYRELWRRYPDARKLGMTATPCRMNRRGFTDLFDILLTSWSVAEFIRKGRLSPFDYVSIKPGSEEQRLIDFLEKRGADGDYQLREMNAVLNRRPSIERLYQSVVRYARGKKGIVYAISIEHARSIAEYYNRKGISTAVIDSRTPAEERRRIVEEFRRTSGRLSVLVNVDVFSEGFDCPDVEFIQLARPTLSLAKYLQQVGRGLRRSEGKDACVIIDNVGLYRVFGLPTVAWDWEAMFRGRMAGKGSAANRCVQADVPCTDSKSMAAVRNGSGIQDAGITQYTDDMEVVMSHASLLEAIESHAACDMPSLQTAQKRELKAWQDGESGLWGLRRGREMLTEARYITVFDIRYDMAAVRFGDMNCGIVNDAGEIIWKKDGCLRVMFLKDRLLHVVAHNREYYVDTYSLRAYNRKPKVKKYGNVELLETDGVYYSRTKTVYINNQGVNNHFIHWQKFYLTIYDEKAPFSGYHKENTSPEHYAGHACILENDNDSYYWLYYRLADGSIIIVDTAQNFYYATEGHLKRYIGCRDTEEEWNRCRAEIEHLARQAEEKWDVSENERIEVRRQQLALSNEAVPFKSGTSWGLRVGNRITIPPIYRKIKSPVGKYCVVEKNYSQWGVVALDGTVMVEPQYSDIEISRQGIVTGTKVTGNKVQVKLP